MHDTYVTVTGNLATKPERRRVEYNGATVVNFRIGSTSRRFDKATGGWVDGNTFFVKVSCWRGLADNAYQSLFKGDPVVVHGRIYTREYVGDDGRKRVSYELEASSLGHNLARGTSSFTRSRPGAIPEVVADDEEPNETFAEAPQTDEFAPELDEPADGSADEPRDEADLARSYGSLAEPVGATG